VETGTLCPRWQQIDNKNNEVIEHLSDKGNKEIWDTTSPADICLWSYTVIVTSTHHKYNEKLEKAKFEEEYEFVAPLPDAVPVPETEIEKEEK